MVDLGLTLSRFSVEWSRLEPVEGYLDHAALDRYREWCRLLRAAGIEPMVTLHHFTEPTWFADRGGFENPAGLPFWERFVTRVVSGLGDLVDLWVTVNEPTGYAVQGWWLGEWPPGAKDPRRAVEVVHSMLTAHAVAADVIRRVDVHDADGDGLLARIGLAHHIVPFRPRRPWSAPAAAAALHDAYNVAVPRALRSGRLRMRVPGNVHAQAAEPRWRDTLDWIGVNAYHPLQVATLGRRPWLDLSHGDTGPVNDLGWEPTRTLSSGQSGSPPGSDCR